MTDPKEIAQAELRRAQREFEQKQGEARAVRLASFRQARKAGLSLREIALRLGIAEKTVENLLGLAQAQVMRALFAQGVAPVRQSSERDYERGRKPDRSKRNRP